MQHIRIARQFIAGFEGCHLHAYPDPRSPLGRALIARFGSRSIDLVGHGKLAIPFELRQMDGSPWTIGYGDTGKHVFDGLRWTQEQADNAFERRLLEFDDAVIRTWPGAHLLHPAARAALISLAYNRGTSLERLPNDRLDRRSEMRSLVPAVRSQDYDRMSDLFLAMRRIWQGEGMGGLLRRREGEAALCRQAARESKP